MLSEAGQGAAVVAVAAQGPAAEAAAVLEMAL
jgi:hypothetical protein